MGPAGSSGSGSGSGGASPGMRSGPCGGVSKGGGDGDGTMGSFGTDTEVPPRSTTWEMIVSSVDARPFRYHLLQHAQDDEKERTRRSRTDQRVVASGGCDPRICCPGQRDPAGDTLPVAVCGQEVAGHAVERTHPRKRLPRQRSARPRPSSPRHWKTSQNFRSSHARSRRS